MDDMEDSPDLIPPLWLKKPRIEVEDVVSR